jgi:hypothetical protein
MQQHRRAGSLPPAWRLLRNARNLRLLQLRLLFHSQYRELRLRVPLLLELRVSTLPLERAFAQPLRQQATGLAGGQQPQLVRSPGGRNVQ